MHELFFCLRWRQVGSQYITAIKFGCFCLRLRNCRSVMEPVRGEVFDLLALEHPPVANEGDRGDAKPTLELFNLRSHGVRIVAIAWEHFDGDRMPVLVAE